MSLKLIEVELWNIRSHKHFVFNPHPTGVTAVSGVNGAGKSTLVDGFAWTLYGTKTNNQKNSTLIREGVDPKTELVQAQSIIKVDDLYYKITRRIVSSSGTVECNVYGSKDNDNYNHLAGPGVSSANVYIKQILKMDERGFLTAVMVQQKQVDQIISASPKERGEIIERLTGVKSISTAIDMAKDEVKGTQKAASLMTAVDTDTLKAEVENNIADGKKLRILLDTLEKDKNVSETTLRALERKYDEADKAYSANTELNTQLKSRKDSLKMIEDDVDVKYKQVDEVKEKLQNSPILALPELKNKVDTLRTSYMDIKGRLDTIMSNKANYTETTKTLVKQAETLSKELSAYSRDDILKSLQEANNKYSEYTEKAQSLAGEIKQVKKSLTMLTGDNKVCPVCKSPIDNPEDLRKEIKSEVDTMKEQLTEAKSMAEDWHTKIAEYTEITNKANNLSDINEELKDLKKKITACRKEENKTRSEADSIKDDLDIADHQYEIANKNEGYRLSLERLGKDILRAENKRKDIQEDIKAIKEEINNSQVLSYSELNALKKEVREQQQATSEITVKYSTTNEKIILLREHVKTLKLNYKRAVEANEKYKQLVDTMNNYNTANKLMNGFKASRVSYSIPTLVMYASTIIDKFTDGEFTKVNLDNKFNASVVTKDGHERPIAQLSGGELSVAAIALRIGIAMLLNDNESNVLILDEILVSMDETRARHIIETITSITNGQVIFIAHNPDIQGVADKVVEINKQK